MNNIYSVGSKRLFDNKGISGLDHKDDIEGIPVGSDIINLHSADTIQMTPQLYSDSLRKKCNLYGCSDTIYEILNNKSKTKTFLNNCGVPCDKGFLVGGSYREIVETVNLNSIKMPFLIKALSESGGEGIFVIDNINDIYEIELKYDYYLIEEFISGNEYGALLFIGNKWSISYPPIYKGSTGYHHTSKKPIHSLEKIRFCEIDDVLNQQISKISKIIESIEGVRGFIDIDIIYDIANKISKVIEINPRVSGLTDLSFATTEFGLGEIVQHINIKKAESLNLKIQNNIVEYPIIHDCSDFGLKKIIIPGARLIRNVCLRRYPPYIQKCLLEFETLEDYTNFVNGQK